MAKRTRNLPEPLPALPSDPQAVSGETPPGDYRGSYGYGRPAHGSDPNASYGFGEIPPGKPGAPEKPE